MSAPVDWLLVGEPWVEYRTRLDLLGQSENDQQVNSSRKSMLANAQVQNLVTELSGWPGTVISSHKSASQSFHKLTFIADLGFTVHDPGVDTIVARILEHQSAEGPFQLPMNIPTHYGGSGHNQWAWALCDAPLIVYALVKFGVSNEPAVKSAIEYLIELLRDNGWPCAVSKELGKFRGPGRKDDPCPFANLAMLKALSEVAELRDSPACHTGADTILNLWSESTTQHPYMFYMGTDFRKLKVPFVWYDLIHVLDVLSRFSWLKNDKRFLDMLGILECKADLQGCFTLESIWTAWKDWEFGQKKMPSRWLTLLAWRIFRRVETASK
ncbi:MAG: hypothetical protein A2X25_07365 [Chloroflexi bacterium GWB2_49_20]|nr:MAG: hypothetical protein A2X25_07365 [Chloroflexi bacterium GWB2_49_20]OGN77974.1 MAG: hypothetical protein A2X26_15170 [Chloroflexi bacterium GWC2_49_37]OGN85012.1 MAG: hypothetical protein A2X27_09870 [Chloroflexi bacterium GWD2_49_16]HBG74955.1 hypothetical protein [Anaerolineae bacterium]HCC78321.1 hypothetical protein [Anaerolineae bacterium]